MPTRMIREGILDSDKINGLSTEAENFFFRLMLCADDFGRFDGRPAVIKSRAYPLKIDMKVSKISKLADECSKAGLIYFYFIDDKPFIEIIAFNQRLRAKKSKYPDRDGQVSDICMADAGNKIQDVGREEKRSRREEKRIDESSFPFLSNDSFKENWNSHLSMTGVNKTIKSQEMRLKKLHEVSVEGATKSLEDSIANGWRGVFPKEGTLQTTKRLQSITMFSEKDKEALLGPLDYSILVRYKANEEMSVEDLNRYTVIQGMKFSK